MEKRLILSSRNLGQTGSDKKSRAIKFISWQHPAVGRRARFDMSGIINCLTWNRMLHIADYYYR